MALLLLFSSWLFFSAGGDVVGAATSQCIRIIHFAMIVVKTTHTQMHAQFFRVVQRTWTHSHDVATMRKIAAKLLKNSTWHDRKRNVHRINREKNKME